MAGAERLACVLDDRSPSAAAARSPAHGTRCLPVHIFGYPADLRPSRRSVPIVEDACEALGARHHDGPAVGGRGNPAVFGSTPTSR